MGETLLQSGPVGPAETLRELLPSALTHPIALAIPLVVGLSLVVYGFVLYRRSTLIRNTPTERVRSAAAGRTELEGTVRPAEETLDAPLSDTSCVYAAWTVKEYDSAGNEWVTVSRGTDASDFYLEDDTGKLLVGTGGADATFEIADDHTTTITVSRDEDAPAAVESFLASGRSSRMEIGAAETYSASDALGAVLNPSGATGSTSTPGGMMTMGQDTGIGTTDAPRRYRQRLLPVGEDVYVYGATRPRRDAEGIDEQRLVLTRDTATDEFIVSDMGEEGIAKHYSRRGPLLIGLGLLVSSLGVYLLAALTLV